MALLRIDNPPNRFHDTHVEWDGPADKARLELFVDRTRRILAENDSPDIGFRWSVNPYRGCFHGCAYCYARPSHEFLGFGAGSDFDRKLVLKPEAAALLEQAFRKPSWRGETVVFSGNTDCYQPLEAQHELTRACLEVCARFRNPVGVITKSPLVVRDLDVLLKLHEEARVMVSLSIPFSDPATARLVEPGVPPPDRRIRAVSVLAAAGLPVNVMVAPVIPGLNDTQLVAVLEEAREAGARHAGMTLVRLPGPVAAVFEDRIRAAFPDRAERILNRIREARGGKLNDPRFGSRMRGDGPYAGAIRALFEKTTRRLGYQPHPPHPEPSPFRIPPESGQQLSLFG